MSTMVQRWLDIADELIAGSPRSTAARRRAVSTAYYAAFHALARLCADELISGCERSSPEYERVYRSLEHGTLKTAFQIKDSPLRSRPSLRSVGELMVSLRTERFRADYLPPVANVFSRAQAEDLVAQARKVIAELEVLSPEDRVSLAAHLLFRDVRQ